MTQWTEISGSSRPHEFTKPVESKKSTLGSGLEICGFVVLILWGA